MVYVCVNRIVTVHAKIHQVSTKIEIHFLAQLIATHIIYLHSMSPMARLNWSAFLGVDLQPCKAMTNTLAPCNAGPKLMHICKKSSEKA